MSNIITETVKFQKLFYEKDGFRIGLFKCADGSTIKAKGMNLPCTKGVLYKFAGTVEDSKYGPTLVVTDFEEIRPENQQGIVKYLMTFKGIGKVSAGKLYAAYGDDLYDVLDKDIDRVFEDKILKKSSFEKLKTSWIEKSAGKELFAYLYNFNIPQKTIARIYDKYEGNAMSVLRTNPYCLTSVYGFSFRVADTIARRNNLDMYSTERIKAGILAVLYEAEVGGSLLNSYNRENKADLQAGNMCLEWKHLYPLLCGLLEIDITPKRVAEIMKGMVLRDLMIVENRYIYRFNSYHQEQSIAENVNRLLTEGTAKRLNVTPEKIAEMQKQASLKGELSGILSDEQCNAVCSALNNPISVITGGPGTGKTMIQKSIINATQKLIPNAKILLAAPTGRAARRMSESTGYPAHTIHSALGIYAGDDEQQEVDEVDCDLLLIDEFSMVDSHIATLLFSAVSNRTRVVMVGDKNQLPSVGPGAVLRELIASEVLPVATLTNVFRQAKGSSIGVNSKRMFVGNTKMLEDESFVFVEKDSSEEIAESVKRLYEENMETYGMDEIMVLSPYRRSTATGVNMLNKELQTLVQNKEIEKFTVGDKVMYTKNDNGLANGDIGFIKKIQKKDNETFFTVDFGEGDVILEDDAIDNLDLAYATTIHKSQGSEAKLVIMVSDKSHVYMLKRNLVYTGVTRAKQTLIVVGDRDTFAKAILKEETSVRLSLLAVFLREKAKEKTEKNRPKKGKAEKIFRRPDGEQLELCV